MTADEERDEARMARYCAEAGIDDYGVHPDDAERLDVEYEYRPRMKAEMRR